MINATTDRDRTLTLFDAALDADKAWLRIRKRADLVRARACSQAMEAQTRGTRVTRGSSGRV